MIRKEAWSFYITSYGVRLCWELEEPKGPKALQDSSGALVRWCFVKIKWYHLVEPLLSEEVCFPDSFPSFTCLVMSLPRFSPNTISQLGFTPSHIATASMSFGVPLPVLESEFPSYLHHPQEGIMI